MGEVEDHQTLDCGDLKAAVAGDDTAFAKFCARSMPSLLRIQQDRCRRFGIPPDLAKDFAQDALLRAVKWLRENPGKEVSTNWLSKVSRNVVFDWLRRSRPRSNMSEVLNATTSIVGIGDDSPAVMEAFEMLPPKDREILRLMLIEELPAAEAADRLEIGLWSAYKRYERALQRIRKLVE